MTDADGVVYRYFAGRGYVFHPLGNFAALNTDLGAGRTGAAQRLAERCSLSAASPLPGGGMGWEYCFDYGGGRAPWLSGMAQATAAQGFAATAALGGADAPRLRAAARGAYRAIPGRLAMRLSEGPWVRLYGFNSDIVLNAQLQSALSIAPLRDAHRRRGRRRLRRRAAPLRRRAAPPLRHRLLDVLPAPAHALAARVPDVRRRPPAPARPAPTRASRTPPRASTRYAEAAARVQARRPGARARPLLALEAGRRDRALERGRDAELPAQRRLVRRRLEAARPRRRVPGADRRPRLGREPRRGRRAADRPRRRLGAHRPHARPARRSRRASRRSRPELALDGSRAGQARPRARLHHGPALARLARRRDRARSRHRCRR